MLKSTVAKNIKTTEKKIRLHMESDNFIDQSAQFLNDRIMDLNAYTNRPLVTVCIGTDRSTGDSLGPLVGWMLKQKQPYNQFVYGTLNNPVHATNMNDVFSSINTTFNNPLIIAIDACLGNLNSIGYVAYNQGSIKPGAAVNKNLPPVGDLSISGVVNVGGFMEYLVLQNTRLSIVMQMADKISQVIAKLYESKYQH
ncbi:putative sporulation protein YyaC [Desulfonispora thiosulfatigenes DSM 11270]|uniref:Putative sporulation protein YyaC n=1 Tax=Desulfonispora thiosulfatigenes DSM 11270 TaxID=656914 RepID=A0A1W1V2S0_DESTI|nr:spore protease YyaC [Desulfonispora thiosulfatigenes]SMB87576.1 putative sporulation protein YyaC [Desulfonispora thiosulfatigenes DSM 11270]